jgi:viroplasmin and RNaseH domain-containing protein
MAKNKFYVVWNGHQQGIYESWEDCKAQTDGFKGAVYKKLFRCNNFEWLLNTQAVVTREHGRVPDGDFSALKFKTTF